MFTTIIETLATDLYKRGAVDQSECFIEGTFCMAKKRAYLWEKLRKVKATKVMAITDATGVVLSISVHSASPHEVTLVEKTLEDRFLVPHPERPIGDKAYDSDKLDERLGKQGTELIAPHRSGRKRPKTQAVHQTLESGTLLCLAV